jgi:protein TonB
MAYLLQIACITLLADVLLRVIPVRAAGFRYAYWRLVLAGSLLAPWLLRTTVISEAVEFVPVGPVAAAIDGGAVARAWSETGPAWFDESSMALLPWFLLAGTVFRLLWVGAGLMRLRAWRRAGEPIVDSLYEEIQQRLGTGAELRSVAEVSQPVTFGLRRPVVLLPESLRTSTDAIRRAVVTHELVHVRRRDWVWVLGEEALRAALWFHPAIWWLTSRIRLTREEFTDHIAVLASGSRRHYLEALVAFADTVQLEPAPAFARRAHLFHRITLLSMEPVMSARRVVFSGALVTMLLVTGGWYASEAFPVVVEAERAPAMQGAGSSVAGGAQELVRPITPENPIPRRVFATPIAYPLELNGTAYESALEMRVVLAANGAITDVRRGPVGVSAPRPGVTVTPEQAMDAFVTAATDAIRRWQYDPPAIAPIAFYVGVVFKQGAPVVVSQSEDGRGVRTTTAGGVRLLTPGEFSIVPFGRAGGAAGGRRGGGPGAVPPPLPPPPPAPGARGAAPGSATPDGAIGGFSAAPPRPGGPIRIGGAIRPPLQTKKVNPIYPPIAQSARVSGVVILEIQVDEQGKVRDPRILRSIPLLDQAALDAVSQWEYQPVLLNGAPVPVIMTVTVDFSLQF